MLIRNILNNSQEEYISLEQEITTLQLYIEMEQIRLTSPFSLLLRWMKKIDMEMDIPTQRIKMLETTNHHLYNIRIVDLRDEHNNALGTEVNLVIPIDK
jgi:LytS/YehU family sensor histidine kinase